MPDPTHQQPPSPEKQRQEARSEALVALTHISNLRADPSFQWFLRDVVSPLHDDYQASALDITKADDEANKSRQRRAGVQSVINALDERERVLQQFIQGD